MSVLTRDAQSDKWWRDSRYIYFVLSTIWVFTLMFSIVMTWTSPRMPVGVPGQEWLVQPMWERIAATIFASAFIVVYVWMMYRVYYGPRDEYGGFTSRGRWEIRIPLIVLATLLAALPYESSFRRWTWTFVFFVIAWTLTSTPDKAFASVLVSTGIAAVIITILYPAGVAVLVAFPAIGFGFMVSGYVINNGIIDQLKLERSRVRDQAVTEERFRLARDLHDTVGHSMTQITLKAELARRLLPDDPARAANELEDIEQLSRSLSVEVRRSIAGEVTLSLQDEVDRATELMQSMNIELDVRGDYADIQEDIADVFAWCLREGVMNVIKHSGASCCEIIFCRRDRQHVLKIIDNGSNLVSENHNGQGIAGMKQRVHELSGEAVFRVTDSGHALTISIAA